MAFESQTSSVQDYLVKSHRLVIPFAIVNHATAANKTSSNDLPDALILSLEGLTATATAADSGCNFTTPTDSTGVFGCLVQNLGTVTKLLDVQVVNPSSGTVAVTRVGASSTGVTASGNIAVSVDSSLSFANSFLFLI